MLSLSGTGGGGGLLSLGGTGGGTSTSVESFSLLFSKFSNTDACIAISTAGLFNLSDANRRRSGPSSSL